MPLALKTSLTGRYCSHPSSTQAPRSRPAKFRMNDYAIAQNSIVTQPSYNRNGSSMTRWHIEVPAVKLENDAERACPENLSAWLASAQRVRDLSQSRSRIRAERSRQRRHFRLWHRTH